MGVEAAQLPFSIYSAAPIRICDNGGWTDTWFAQHGVIFNIAVYPCVEVQLRVYPRSERQERILIEAENYGESFAARPNPPWGKHALLEAAFQMLEPPETYAVEANIYSRAPGGAATGTSAAVTVALLGALERLHPQRRSAYEIARLAHRVETELLGLQSGIQDQLCAAYGGINYIEMFAYPQAQVSPVRVSDETWWELERGLALIYLGKSHQSSSVHEMVIRGLENAGPDCAELQSLRQTAPRSRQALAAGDFKALGQAMIDNTLAQQRLHPDLVSEDARQVIEIAQRYGALGWKVNGAGGDGGSLTLLCSPLSAQKRQMLREIEQANPRFSQLPIQLSRHGLRVWHGGV